MRWQVDSTSRELAAEREAGQEAMRESMSLRLELSAAKDKLAGEQRLVDSLRAEAEQSARRQVRRRHGGRGVQACGNKSN